MSEMWLQFKEDIKLRQNLELYLTMIVGIAVFVLEIFELAGDYVSNVVLAVLIILIFGRLEDRRTYKKIADDIESLGHGVQAQSLFSTWNNQRFIERLKDAKTLSIYSMIANTIIAENADDLKHFLHRGGVIELLCLPPDGQAIKMLEKRTTGETNQVRYDRLAQGLDLSVQYLKEISQFASTPDNVKLKTIDYLPASVLTLLDRNTSHGAAFVTLNGFNLSSSARPSFILEPTDGEWYDFYQKTFDSLWSSKMCREIEL